jgi:hypothetical protein
MSAVIVIGNGVFDGNSNELNSVGNSTVIVPEQAFNPDGTWNSLGNRNSYLGIQELDAHFW